MTSLPSGILTNVIFTYGNLTYVIFTNVIFTYGNLTYGIFTYIRVCVICYRPLQNSVIDTWNLIHIHGQLNKMAATFWEETVEYVKHICFFVVHTLAGL